MRFRFGPKFLLLLWLVSLLTGCAWAFPAIPPLTHNHQYPVYADISYDDTAAPDMYISCDDASYEATHRHARSPLIASVSDILPRFRVAHRITTARYDETSTGVATLAHGEIFSPRLERIGDGRAVTIAGAITDGRMGADRTTQFTLIRSELENLRLTSERPGIRRSDNPEASAISYCVYAFES